MPEIRCRTCGRLLRYEKVADLPHFPFCSERCRLIDLGAWLDEEHRISGAEDDVPRGDGDDRREE